MKLSKKIAAGVVAGTAAVSLTACGPASKPSAQKIESKAAAAGATNLETAQPVPVYGYSQLRQNLIELENAQANGTITTSFFMNMGEADPIMSCPSIGSPIPSTDELTNPSQVVSDSNDQDAWAASIGQMDPTGVYTGDSTGTYVMCVGANGDVDPIYWEGFVATAFGPAHWDTTTHTIVVDGPASSKFTGLKK